MWIVVCVGVLSARYVARCAVIFTQSPTHPHIQSIKYSLTHSLTHPLNQPNILTTNQSINPSINYLQDILHVPNVHQIFHIYPTEKITKHRHVLV